MTHTSEPTFDLKPSQYLRAKRPELYSDSKKVQQYKIDRATLDHHLSTVTERNQHKDFENFCRKIAEIEICRNLRPQTGPEGGGDGKIDTETFPVSDRIAETWYVGQPNSNKELWGFAISANKAWGSKVQKDVKNAIGTNRGYSKIFFFTNQNPSQKKRLELQDKLGEEYGISLTIIERNWLVDKTMTNDYSDLVFQTLGIGEYNPECEQKGPRDLMRHRELQKIEQTIQRFEESGLSDFNMVSYTLRAANLSRELELPRCQTVRRYERATRIADKYGGAFQKFLARYEKARTQIYWFDDLEEAHKLYDELEVLALEIKTSKVLELLGNILDPLAYYQRNFKFNDFKLKNRFDTLRENLEILASNLSRPNESLHARTLLKINELRTLWRSRDSNGIDKIMLDLADILNESKGMGEFPSSLIPGIVNELPNLQIEGEAYDRLISIVAEYSSEKTSEGEQGKLLKKRGLQAIETGSFLDATDWLGKATLAFSKAEYRDEQIETKYFLAVAYEKGNLLWAARATILSCLTSITTIVDDESKFHDKFFVAADLFCLISLRLGHLPDTLLAFRLLTIVQRQLNDPEKKFEEYSERYETLENILTCVLVSVNDEKLERLTRLPETLSLLGLFHARTVLMVRLGQADHLIQEDVIGKEELAEIIAIIKEGQSMRVASEGGPTEIILNDETTSVFCTNVLSVDIEFNFSGGEKSISICEYLMSGLEAFAANMMKNGVYPCTNFAKVFIEIDAKVTEIELQQDQSNCAVTLKWPESVEISELSYASIAQHGLEKFIIAVIGLISTADEKGRKAGESIDRFDIFERSAIFSNSSITHSRVFGNSVSQITDVIPGIRSSVVLFSQYLDKS